MRSALVCVLLALFIKEATVAADDFRPTPIPLDEWRPGGGRRRAGTLHETIKTASPPTIVAIPAHYWEDALRHSVYLTLVRDKIDQLIAKGDTVESDSKENKHASKNVDDQDLWEKVKAAPFDRINDDEPTTYGDVTILARGRLMEESSGFRFAEDDKSHEKCDNEKCMDGVKAFWSVKRVRQRDQEISPGRYHYELTFSVMSQIPKKHKKPFEHPIRTFTVQEHTNDRVTDQPGFYHKPATSPPQVSRPERAIWFHKNIVPTPRYHKQQHRSELDRLFSSLFDYDDDEPSYETPRRYKQNPNNPPYSKVGYAGSASSEQHTQLKSLPYPYKLHSIQHYSHSPITPPTDLNQLHNLEQDNGGIGNPYLSQTDYIPTGYNSVERTTRPAVLPTPLPPLMSSSREFYVKKGNTIKYDMLENATNPPVTQKQYNKIKTPVKANYFPEHLRPPIYNAPPGVFVTMDKKPFKPMPPLKMPATKPIRNNKPIDFRPSPQVLDVQFSEPDPFFDTAFRPITANYADNSNSTEKALIYLNNENREHKLRKPIVNAKKPPRKQDHIISHRFTTNIPDIITADNNLEEDDVMEIADIIGIFAKTTPMQKEKNKTSLTTLSLPASTTPATSTTNEISTQTPTTITMTFSTTVKPKKRTRPPPKFNKTEKIKKHKRITTTTTSTTTPTNIPLIKSSDEVKKSKLGSDLIPQASTVHASSTKKTWKPSSKLTSTTPSSTIGTSTTTNPTTTATITKTTSKPVESETTSTTRANSINRFRQSTLMIKGTSVKHDKWSVTNSASEKLRGSSISSNNYNQRRKGSNFHGYISSTPKNLDEERMRHDHIDGTSTIRPITLKSEITTQKAEDVSTMTAPSEETGEKSINGEDVSHISEERNQQSYEESRDHDEYIFQQSSDTANDKSNEIIDTEATFTTEKITMTPSLYPPKSKKCKKKQQTTTKNQEIKKNIEIIEPTTTNAPITTTSTTPSMLEDLLNDFSFDDNVSEQSHTTTSTLDLDKKQPETHEQYFEENDALKELLDSIKNENKYEELSEDYETDDHDDDEDDDDDDNEDEEPKFEEEETNNHQADSSHYSNDNDYDEKRPLTLLELMAME